MDLKKYMINTYPTVGPFEGVNAITDLLLEHQYLVVVDKEKFYGILTASDIVERPYRIVADCITKKQSVTAEDTIVDIFDKFLSNRSCALPVMDEDELVGVIEKVHIAKALENRVVELYDKSLISKKVKKYYLNNLSHEIRTPLNGIVGLLDILSSYDIEDTTYRDKDVFDVIKKSTDRFLKVMDDLVELSLLYAGEDVKISKTEIVVNEILAGLEEFFHQLPLPEDRKAKVICLNAGEVVSICTDGRRLRRIMFHLIDNAIKFSENNTAVYGFEMEPGEEDIRFFVRSEDSGIFKKNRERMFDLFDKQDKIGKELNSGLGIGLPLVKKLTELLGGQIYVESENSMITFFVKIPLKQ